MPRTTNREHCVFQKVEQRVYCRIPMEGVGWIWVRERRNEDASWMPILKCSDDSAMYDSVVAFVVEQPSFPRGACDNCFQQIQITDN